MEKFNYKNITDKLESVFKQDVKLNVLNETTRLKIIKEVKQKQVEWYATAVLDNSYIHWVYVEELDDGSVWFQAIKDADRLLSKTEIKPKLTDNILYYLKLIRNKRYYVAEFRNKGYAFIPKLRDIKSNKKIECVYFLWNEHL